MQVKFFKIFIGFLILSLVYISFGALFQNDPIIIEAKTNGSYAALIPTATNTPIVKNIAAILAPTITMIALPTFEDPIEETPTPIYIKITPSPIPANTLSEELSALRDLHDETNNNNEVTRDEPILNPNGRIYGVRSSNPVPASDSSTQPTPQPTIKPSSPIKYFGQARGYTMLAFSLPKARETMNAQIQNMLDSGVKDLYLSILIDSFFDFDAQYIKDVLSKLSDNNSRRIIFHAFLVSGPTQETCDQYEEKSLLSYLCPYDFAEKIFFDFDTRKKLKNLAKDVAPIFEHNLSLGTENENLVSTVLEDFLLDEEYSETVSIVKPLVPSDVIFHRNPCYCQDSPEDPGKFNSSIESHNLDILDSLGTGDGISLDGTGHYFSVKDAKNKLSTDEVKRLFKHSVEKGLAYSALWRFERQGLGAKASKNTLPDDRNYEVPTAEQLRVERDILVAGLSEVAK